MKLTARRLIKMVVKKKILTFWGLPFLQPEMHVGGGFNDFYFYPGKLGFHDPI